MAAVNSYMVPLGTPMPDFDLPSVQGGRVRATDLREPPALLVAFLSNHCPYVQRIEGGLATFAADYPGSLAMVGICSNDAVRYPDDDEKHLAEQIERAGFAFPYLIDETQEVAKAYRAACTPDFFLYDEARRLVYRGEFDAARPSNDVGVTGESLRNALDAVLGGQAVPDLQNPSLGCSIKWKPGNEP